MPERERGEPVKLYLDDDPEPFKVAYPPLTFQFNTIALPDGPHTLRIEASNGLAPPTVKTIPFVVRNGVAVTASGLEPGQTIAGQVQMVINAYAGSTEVDFEPRKAETPQPIPTWAWVVLLGVVAWTMYYLVTPQVRSSAATVVPTRATAAAGARVFADACARCHGEAGEGLAPKIPPLRDAAIALAESPAALLVKVTTSTPGSMMPKWGIRLTNEEIVAVTNHLRHSWGHDSREIRLVHRTPPEGIDDLNANFSRALKQKDLGRLMSCCATDQGLVPQIFRTDGVDERGAAAVQRAWANYFEALGEARARVTRLALPDARYDYDPATVDQDGAIVIANGRIFLETRNEKGDSETAKGRFLRVYQRHGPRWTLAFDFADIPMAVGCVPGTVICPPGEEGKPLPPVVTPAPPPAAGTPSPIGYADVQKMIASLGRGARSAPHDNFWELPYEDFLTFTFDAEIGDPERQIRVVVPGNSRASNLIKALRGDPSIVVEVQGGGTEVREDIQRMPQGGPHLSEAEIAKIAAWIDAGCPEFAGEVVDRPPAPPAPPAPSEGRVPVPQDPFTPPAPGFPPPQPTPAPAPSGFPPPAPPQPAPAGFPPPAPPAETEPAAPAGFPPPAPPGETTPPAPALGYAEIQEILDDLAGRETGLLPDRFWELEYEAFVNLEFAPSAGEAGRTRLLVPGNAKASTLVRALRDGKGVVVHLPDGARKTVDVPRVPGDGPALKEETIRAVEAWIDAGCPEVAPR